MSLRQPLLALHRSTSTCEPWSACARMLPQDAIFGRPTPISNGVARSAKPHSNGRSLVS